MMTKENTLFSIIGVLLGFIIGFMFANSVNMRGEAVRSPQIAPTTTTATAQNSTAAVAPSNEHPVLPSNTVAEQGGPQADVQAAIDLAKTEPNNFEAQIKAAELYYQIKRYERAIELLLRANQLRPENYEVLLNLGNANFEAGKHEQAERWYTAALLKKPDDVNARSGLGLAFLARQPSEVDRAITEFRRSLEVNPRHEQTLHFLIVALTRKGDAAEAQATLARLEQVNPSNKEIPELRAHLAELRSGAKS